MAGPGEQFTSLISGLFATRLVTVRFPVPLVLHLADLIMSDRILKVSSAIGEASELL